MIEQPCYSRAEIACSAGVEAAVEVRTNDVTPFVLPARFIVSHEATTLIKDLEELQESSAGTDLWK